MGTAPQLQAHFRVKPKHAFVVHLPSLSAQKHVNAPIAVAHTRLGNLLDPILQIGLRRTRGFKLVARPACAEHIARPPDADLPDTTQLINQRAP